MLKPSSTAPTAGLESVTVAPVPAEAVDTTAMFSLSSRSTWKPYRFPPAPDWRIEASMEGHILGTADETGIYKRE